MAENAGLGSWQDPSPEFQIEIASTTNLNKEPPPQLQAASPPRLWPYQVDVIEQCREQFRAGKKRICLVAPTGSGKTVIAADIIRRIDAGDKRVLVLAHTREIVGQTSAKLKAVGVDHGIILAEQTRGSYHNVQVASVQTYWARVMRTKRMAPPAADLIIVDECHHIRARTWHEIIKSYPGVRLIGLTATPCRGDGRGLGEIFEVMVECPQVPELIKLGHLVGTKVFAPPAPDLSGIKVQAGDYVETQLGARMNTDGLVGDIVTQWCRYADGLKTIIFAVDVGHSQHIAAEFVRAGVCAEHVDGSTPTKQRKHILNRLASGITTVVSNCKVLTEGFDLPDIECIVLARPTKKMGTYRQMVGRGLRPANGKRYLVVLDHAGAVYPHGLAEDPIEWPLSKDKRAFNPQQSDSRRRDTDGSYQSRIIDCVGCGAKRISGFACVRCGYFPQRPPNAIIFNEGDLQLYDALRRRSQARTYTPEEMAEWHGMLAWIGAERGYKPSYVNCAFKDKFGDWPPRIAPKLIKPNSEVLAWSAHASSPTPNGGGRHSHGGDHDYSSRHSNRRQRCL